MVFKKSTIRLINVSFWYQIIQTDHNSVKNSARDYGDDGDNNDDDDNDGVNDNDDDVALSSHFGICCIMVKNLLCANLFWCYNA